MTTQPTDGGNSIRLFLRFMQANGEVLADQHEDEQSLRATQIVYSVLSKQFVIVLSLASLIATLGLMADSTVAIVGAMLIAPLMKPIMAATYGLVAADWRLQFRALLTLTAGIATTMLIAALGEQTIGLKEMTIEIMARTQPSLIDLGIAVAAGVAAALATVRRNVADTLPGVAISVSLVPPLCVSGIGFSTGNWQIGTGAVLLFSVNLFAIILSAAIVFLLEGYGSLRRAWPSVLIILIVLGALSLPLTAALRQLRADDLAQETVERYLHEQYPVNKVVHPDDLSQLDVMMMPEHVFVFMEVKSPADVLTEARAAEIHRRLVKAFNRPVNLKVQLLMSKDITVYPYQRPDGTRPDYGLDNLVPRR